MAALLHNDLVRVFELPVEGPSGYRFGGGVPVSFLEVDWFNALPPLGEDLPDPLKDADHWEAEMREYIAAKRYVQPGRRYLVLCLHRSFVFEGEAA